MKPTTVITILPILFAAACLAQAPAPQPHLDQLLANKQAAQAKLADCTEADQSAACNAARQEYTKAVFDYAVAINATLAANAPKVADATADLAKARAFLSASEEGLPDIVFFFGTAADPNGGVADVSVDVGGAKLVGSSTYFGGVAHFTKGNTPSARISSKLQFHIARHITKFRGARVFWTAEAGPDIVATQSLPSPPGPMTTNVGYALGSGPLVSIPIRKAGFSLAPHAEFTKGSMQDFGWRGGILFNVGSN